MIDLNSYGFEQEDLEFINDLYEILCVGHTYIDLEYLGYCFEIDPCQQLEVWHNGECVGRFEDFDDLLLNFKIDGKPFIECVPDMEYVE